MPKTVFTGAHQELVDLLIEKRKAAGLTQTELGDRIGKDQKLISLIEQSQRRIDVLEFVVLAKALGAKPLDLFAELVRRLPSKFSI